MEKRNAALLLLWLAAVLCWYSPEGTAEIAKDTLKSAATNTGIDGAQHSHAPQRFSGHNRHPLRGTEEDRAPTSVDSASETQRYASGKANEMGEMAFEKLGDLKNIASNMGGGGLKEKVKDKALDAYAFCSEKAEQGIEMASNLSTDAEEIGKGSASNSYGYSSDTIIKQPPDNKQVGDEKSEAFKRYEDAKSEVYETCAFAKDSMTEQAKEKYEHAKESSSQATGDLGAKMRTCPSY